MLPETLSHCARVQLSMCNESVRFPLMLDPERYYLSVVLDDTHGKLRNHDPSHL